MTEKVTWSQSGVTRESRSAYCTIIIALRGNSDPHVMHLAMRKLLNSKYKRVNIKEVQWVLFTIAMLKCENLPSTISGTQ